MRKLERIEKSRHEVQERVGKEVEVAKKEREKREDPKMLAKNRQRSIDYLRSKSRREMERRSQEHSGRSPLSPSPKKSIEKSLSQHVETKRRL